MKTKVFLFVLLVVAIFTACETVDFNLPEDKAQTERESQIRLKVGAYASDTNTEIFLEQGVMSVLTIESKVSNNPVLSASWSVEGKSYDGLGINHRFSSLGEVKLSVSAHFKDDQVESRDFTINIVKDLSEVGPLVIKGRKINSSSYSIWFGWDKRYLRSYSGDSWYILGDLTKWEKVALPAASDYNLVNGEPTVTTNGRYIGCWVAVNSSNRDGLKKMALSATNGSWVNIAGSPYAQTGDPGLAYFQIGSDGSITPKGDGATTPSDKVSMPGESGDNYFRFNQFTDSLGKTNLFFRLDNDWTNKAFVIREIAGGEFGTPISLAPVNEFPDWGSLSVTYASLLDVVSAWRYGPDVSVKNAFSDNMTKSLFYDEALKSIRLQVTTLKAVKKQEN